MLHKLLCVLGCLLFAAACTSSHPVNSHGPSIDNGYQLTNARHSLGGEVQIDHPARTVSLADQLQSVAGVSVTGQGPNARVRIHGGLGFTQSEPLFVVDGQPFSGFAQVYSAVNVVDIKSITVLKDTAQTAVYGGRGAGGVIVIRTKTSR